MRWLVEVSRVGDTAASERYCIEAKRWQAALQEARRFRGDSGALPKLTIELLDHGYRAVDPQLKVRYVVTEAPAGMPLTEGTQALLTTYPPPAVLESQPPGSRPPHAATGVTGSAPAATLPPAFTASSSPSASPSSVPPPTMASARPSSPPAAQVIRQREERTTEANPIEYRELALAVKPGVLREELAVLLEAKLDEVRAGMDRGAKRYVQIAVFDHMFVKRPVRPPLATLVWKDWRGEPVIEYPGFGDPKRVSSVPPSSPALSTRAPSWLPSGAPPSVSAAPLGPLPQNLGGSPFLPRSSVAPAPVTSVPVPSTAPAPVVSVGSGAPSEAPRSPSVIPARVVSVGPSSPPTSELAPAQQPVPVRPAVSRSTLPSAPPPSAPLIEVGEAVSFVPSEMSSSLPSESASLPAPIPVVPEELLRQEAERVAETEREAAGPDSEAPLALSRRSQPPPEPAPQAALTVEGPSVVVTASAAPVAPSAPAPKASEPPPPQPSQAPAQRRSDPISSRRSGGAAPRRRAAGEDLIGDLFESIHELSFMMDLVSGADFVIRVISDVIPCEAIVVHAFDLGRREFVVVRARGPNARNALLHRTPDADPVVREVMRRRSLISNGASPLRSGAFEKLGTAADMVLSAAARQGGRYLGLIELANPLGGAPFHENEASALEYVCEQFAEFVASRPVVLDEDVVLGR